MKKRKIAIIINHLSFFCSHILPVALAAKKNGYVVKIFCGYGGSKEMEVEAKKIILNSICSTYRLRINIC